MSTEASVALNSRQENPFQANGELSRKADYIISHSRISRTEVQIADPDSSLTQQSPSLDEDDAVFIATSDEPQVPILAFKDEKPIDSEIKQQSEQMNTQHSVVEVDVVKTEHKSHESPQKAEQIKLKSKKCCAIQ